jgi:hypothetical protein
MDFGKPLKKLTFPEAKRPNFLFPRMSKYLVFKVLRLLANLPGKIPLLRFANLPTFTSLL